MLPPSIFEMPTPPILAATSPVPIGVVAEPGLFTLPSPTSVDVVFAFNVFVSVNAVEPT